MKRTWFNAAGKILVGRAGDGRVTLRFPHENVEHSFGSETWVGMVKEISPELFGKPQLGCATTGELIDEIKARAGDLSYKTIDS